MNTFAAFLKNKEMEVIETYGIREYRAGNFIDDSDRTDQINYAVRKVKQDGEECYVYVRASETMEYIGEDLGG